MGLVDTKAPSSLRRALMTAARGRNDDFPLDLSWARDFEREVLVAAREIPYGQTRSYSWLARTARRPLAVRAAASVMARNPLWLLVPCHRVIYADGRLGPYGSSGQRRKLELLAREGVHVERPRGRRRKRSSARPRTNPR
jgi:O-6-methylguanine DNA methyltransferase